MSFRWVPILIAIAISLPASSWPHGGGLDSQGGHNDRQAGVYHFHNGPLQGQIFASKEDATTALTVTGGTDEPDTPAQIPLVDLTPYLPSHTPDAQIITHRAYTLQYSEVHEQAAWVVYRITDEQPHYLGLDTLSTSDIKSEQQNEYR